MEAALVQRVGGLRHHEGLGVVVKSQQFKNLRKQLGLERLTLARLIGYTGTDRNDVMRIRGFEGKKQVPLHIARYLWLLVEYRRITGKFPTFPDWPGYEYDHTPDPEHQKDKIHGFY